MKVDQEFGWGAERTLASAGTSIRLYLGFPMISTKIAFVFSSIASAKASGVFFVTHFTPIPNFLKVTLN
jgi:hypothetical protein